MSDSKRVIPRDKFYQLCESLKERKQEFLSNQPSAEAAAKTLSDTISFPVSAYALKEAMRATGIKWLKSRKLGASDKSVYGNRLRTLTVAIYRLYKKLGEETPSSLEALHNLLSSRDASDTAKENTNGTV